MLTYVVSITFFTFDKKKKKKYDMDHMESGKGSSGAELFVRSLKNRFQVETNRERIDYYKNNRAALSQIANMAQSLPFPDAGSNSSIEVPLTNSQFTSDGHITTSRSFDKKSANHWYVRIEHMTPDDEDKKMGRERRNKVAYISNMPGDKKRWEGIASNLLSPLMLNIAYFPAQPDESSRMPNPSELNQIVQILQSADTSQK